MFFISEVSTNNLLISCCHSAYFQANTNNLLIVSVSVSLLMAVYFTELAATNYSEASWIKEQAYC